MAFTQKTVNSSLHLGIDLADLRERSGFTVEQASHKTKILPSTIRLWESDQWSSDDPFYDERQLQSYVKYLGGNELYFLQKYRSMLRDKKIKTNTDHGLPNMRRVRWYELSVGTRIWALLGFLLFTSLIGGYVYWLWRRVNIPPELVLYEPEDGARVYQPKVTIRGKTQPEAVLTINDQRAIVQPDGSFVLTMDIPGGLTMLTIASQRRHGAEKRLIRQVYFSRLEPDFDAKLAPVNFATDTTSTTR